jgi:hypothetical protein
VGALTRDPNSHIAASAEHLAETLTKKNSDYAPTDEFSNFRKSAEAAGITVIQLITAQIAIKMTRVEKLLRGGASAPRNESLKDSFLDLAGYAAIGHAWLSYVEEPETNEAPIEDVITDRETIRNSFDSDCFHSWVQVSDNWSECSACLSVRRG